MRSATAMGFCRRLVGLLMVVLGVGCPFSGLPPHTIEQGDQTLSYHNGILLHEGTPFTGELMDRSDPQMFRKTLLLIYRLENLDVPFFERKVGRNVEHSVGQPLERMVNRSLSDGLFQRVVHHAVRRVVRNVGRIVEQTLG